MKYVEVFRHRKRGEGKGLSGGAVSYFEDEKLVRVKGSAFPNKYEVAPLVDKKTG